MAGELRKRRNIANIGAADPMVNTASLSDPTSDLEVYSKEVLMTLISDNLPPTPNNFSLYFDRILEDKSENLRKQINSILELEESNDDEKTIELEKSLKQGFNSVKNILQLSANLYKNMSLMNKILEKHQKELGLEPEAVKAMQVISSLDKDVSKLNTILKKQITQMKSLYDDTANVVKNVEKETIFDNQYGVYNKRYLITKLEQECQLIKEFKHKSSLVMLQLSRSIVAEVDNEKALSLMTRTISRLLMKTSRRSDIIAHYGDGIFSMVLKHTDIASAQKASDRLKDLVSSSNFFLAEKEVQLNIAIGISEISTQISAEEGIVGTLEAMQDSHENDAVNYTIFTVNTQED